MERLESFTQSYSQAPWRKQLQFVGVFVAILVAIALVAALYLSVSARTAKAGREIQQLQGKIVTIDQEIEDLKSKLAILRSAQVMSDRARSMGYKPIKPDQTLYILIPGYSGRQPAVLAPLTQPAVINANPIPSEHTESLFVWLRRKLQALAVWLGGALP